MAHDFEKEFEVVGYSLSPTTGYHTYYLLQNGVQHGTGRQGKLALACTKKSTAEEPLYIIGETVEVAFSTKYKKFYIKRKDG